MSKLLNQTLKRFMIYAGLVLIASIPVYYLLLRRLWQYELDEHHIVLTKEAGREDNYLIIALVTGITLLFFLLLLTGLVMLNRRISKRLWQPFYRSLEQIRNFDLSRQDKIYFESTGIDEFSELNESLDKLIAGNVAAYTQQKEFADNASHELQTPLAIIQFKLELLLQSKSLTTDQYEIIEDALKALSRVARINKNLLLLTKIENSQFMEKEAIDFSELLENTISAFGPFSESKELAIKTIIPSGIMVKANKILVEILLNNLITNAIRYSPPQGTISITLNPHSFTITNSGGSALQETQLFKRFATSSAQKQGTGLGLSLVKQISNRYNWNILYQFSDNQHVFSLHFK